MKQLRNLFDENYSTCEISVEEQKNTFTYLNISSQETTDNLSLMILKHISGNDISIHDIQNELSQLIIEYYQKKGFNKDYYNFLSFLRDYTRGNRSYVQKIYKCFTYSNEWKKVITLYSQWKNVNDTDYSAFTISGLPSREKMIAKVSRELRKYKIEVINGHFALDNKKIELITNDLEDLIKKTGGNYFLNHLFTELQKRKYDSRLKRYLLPKELIRYGDEARLSTPYNFLIHISLKYIKIEGKNKYHNKKYLQKIINLSERLVFLYDLQDFHNINKNSFPEHWTIETLYKNILYDNVFRFKQISLDKIEYILKGLFSNTNIKVKLDFDLTEYLLLIRKLYSKPQHSLIKYPFGFFNSNEIKILDKISHSVPNTKYSLVSNIKNIDFFTKPLIKMKDSYLLIDKNYCAWNFYEFLLKELSYPDIGTSLENLIIDNLKCQGYQIYNGNYINSQKEKAECDAVIEATDKIFFIEIKKKAITSKALEGDELKVAEDIVDSFIHSQEQILKHEYSIKLDGKIKFENGSVLQLNNREIIKVSITLFDNYMLNDKMMALNIFEYFQNIRFSNPTKKLGEKNKIIDNIVAKLNLIYKDNPEEYRKNRYDVYFLSLELFLYYLQTNKPIGEVLQDIRQVSFSTGDLYYEYIEIMKIKNHRSN